MTSVKENQWQWLRPYYHVAKVIGWLLLFMGASDFIAVIYSACRPDAEQQLSLLLPKVLGNELGVLRGELMPGILALGIAQFLQWLSDKEYHPGILLRIGPRLLILAASVYLIRVGLTFWRIPATIKTLDGNLVQTVFLGIMPSLLIQIVPIIICLGMAEALRRIAPIVDESKELV